MLRLGFEPDKTHPKDWANPGRVKVQLKDHENGNRPVTGAIKSKAHLYSIIGEWLVDNPTKKESPLDLRLPGLPIPEKFVEYKVHKPRGWKMGTILPVHSDAVTGGGVRDDFFQGGYGGDASGAEERAGRSYARYECLAEHDELHGWQGRYGRYGRTWQHAGWYGRRWRRWRVGWKEEGEEERVKSAVAFHTQGRSAHIVRSTTAKTTEVARVDWRPITFYGKPL